MKMPEYCVDCKDRGSEVCAINDSAVSARSKAALVGGYALIPLRVAIQWDATEHLPKLREPFTNAAEDVAACVRAHQPEVTPLNDWPHLYGSRREQLS